MAANMLLAFHCQHTPPYSLWCSNNDPKCWEAEGLSSRMIEMKMKGIQTLVAGASGNVPHDSDDFSRCYRLLQKYPEWIPRLGEMAKYGETWKHLITRWTQLTQLYESKQFEKLDFLLKHLKKTAGLLHTYQVSETDDFKLVGDVSLACLVRRDNQDEYDIDPVAIVAIVDPPNYLKIYDNSGKVCGWSSCRQIDNQIKDEPIRTKEQEAVYVQIDSAITGSPEMWTSCIFHHCPHFASPLSDSTQMFAAEVYSPNGKKMGCCLISVLNNHPLHPNTTSKPENVDGLIVYNNCLWQVSSSPIAENTYYETGLINV
jgi:hypothetical protein